LVSGLSIFCGFFKFDELLLSKKAQEKRIIQKLLIERHKIKFIYLFIWEPKKKHSVESPVEKFG
jgi:hypothetical protein